MSGDEDPLPEILRGLGPREGLRFADSRGLARMVLAAARAPEPPDSIVEFSAAAGLLLFAIELEGGDIGYNEEGRAELSNEVRRIVDLLVERWSDKDGAP